MYRFYVDRSQIGDGEAYIEGSDVNHIKNVLRIQKGDWIIACDGDGTDYVSRVQGFEEGRVLLNIEKIQPTDTELGCEIVLFQGLPKKDKMEFIIQKAIELGAAKVVPVEMKRCVARINDDKKAKKKQERWQTIAESAAKQSGRGMIPEGTAPVSLKAAFDMAKNLEYNMIPYELQDGMEESKKVVKEACTKKSVGIFIGPEGGFERDEVDAAIEMGIHPISLGRRILRTETAGMALLSIMMFEIE